MRIGVLLAAGISLAAVAFSSNIEPVSGSNTEPGLEMVDWEAGAAPAHEQVLADMREEQDRVNAANVFGPDDRFAVANTTGTGWRTITFLLLYDQDDDLIGTCSGVFLNYNVVLTAAHCLFEAGEYVHSVVAAPGASEDAPEFGLADAAHLAVPIGWADGPGQDPSGARANPSKFDWGIVVFEGDPFDSVLAPYPVMAHAEDEFFEAATTSIATAGFPGDKPFGSMWGADSFEYFVDELYLYTLMDIYSGQSGSPIFAMDDDDFFIFSVVSLGGNKSNLSVRFTPPVLDALEEYCSDLGCTVETYTWEEVPTPTPTPTPTATPTKTPSPTPSPTPAATASPTAPSATPSSNRPFRGVAPQLSRD